jgi:hypothetical protein
MNRKRFFNRGLRNAPQPSVAQTAKSADATQSRPFGIWDFGIWDFVI